MNLSSSFRAFARLGTLAAALLVCIVPALADDINFEFDVPGVLPSSQGATYIGTSESAANSVNNGLLQQDNVSLGGRALYTVPGSYDPSFDATFEVSARVLQNGG